jgi:uncharacterized coiled-coil protein SlyX
MTRNDAPLDPLPESPAEMRQRQALRLDVARMLGDPQMLADCARLHALEVEMAQQAETVHALGDPALCTDLDCPHCAEADEADVNQRLRAAIAATWRELEPEMAQQAEALRMLESGFLDDPDALPAVTHRDCPHCAEGIITYSLMDRRWLPCAVCGQEPPAA